MKFIIKNVKLVIGILLGMFMVSGVSVYATYKYFSTDVSYIKGESEMSVAGALNELYAIKRDYIKPEGTQKITTKSNQIDVSNYQYADTTELYTLDEVTTGEGVYWKQGTAICNSSGTMEVTNIGFRPSRVFIYTTFTSNSKSYSVTLVATNLSTTLWFTHVKTNEAEFRAGDGFFSIENNGFILNGFGDIYTNRQYNWVAIK